MAVLFAALWTAVGYQFLQTGEVVSFAGLMARDRQYPPLHDYIGALDGMTRDLDYLVGFTEIDRLSHFSYNRSNSTVDYYLESQLDIDGKFLHASLQRYRLERDVRAFL